MTASARPAEPGLERLRAVQRKLIDQPGYILAAILVLLLIITDIISPGYLSARQTSGVALTAAILGVLAGGQTVVLLTAGVDLSVATTASASAYLMAAYGTDGIFVAVGVGLLVGLVVGLVNGIGVGIFRVQPLIMTLGVSGVTAGLLTVYSVGHNGAPVVPEPIHQLGTGTVLQYLPWDVLLLWLPVAAILMLGLRFTGLGRSIYAVGDNPIACRLAGVRVWQVLLVTYVISGLTSALAGIALAGNANAVDLQLATTYLLPSVAAAVIGGTSVFGGVGGYGGTILGALILTVLDSLLVLLNAPQSVREILYGMIILALAWIYARAAASQ